MDIDLEPGRYVVAVSGGLDSVALLHMLHDRPDVHLTVAHFDHGIRPDSAEDLRHVRDLARKYGLPFVYHLGRLGEGASEAAARHARYEFLHKVRSATGAKAVLTAHHHDDALETAILNIIRGTGRRGVTSLRSTDIVKRPLLHVPKEQIHRYARDNQLVWREDSTNRELAYRRNYIRHNILPRFSPEDRHRLHDIILAMRTSNDQIDGLLNNLLSDHDHRGKLDRQWFIMLPHAVSREVMAAWLRGHKVADIDRKMIERAVHAAKIFPPGQRIDLNHNNYLFIGKNDLALSRSER
jgi:tRNA(Ile)-lysidine synthase